MSWSEIKAAKRKLHDVGDGPIAVAWQEFVATVQRTKNEPPYHISILLNRIEQYRGQRQNDEIAILDHGCGGGLTLLYMAARGYTDIYGVDIGGDQSMQNRISREILHHPEPRFSISDGKSLPLLGSSIDVVFSQQVLEHVTDESVTSYFVEECRVLKPGGWAIHQIPHRLTPYDSHTRAWLIHYFPRPLHRALARMSGRTVPDHLHLRWPWFHRRALKEHIGSFQDLTLERLRTVVRPSYYDGPIRLRSLISWIILLPLIGEIAGHVLRHFVMMETLSVRKGRML